MRAELSTQQVHDDTDAPPIGITISLAGASGPSQARYLALYPCRSSRKNSNPRIYQRHLRPENLKIETLTKAESESSSSSSTNFLSPVAFNILARPRCCANLSSKTRSNIPLLTLCQSDRTCGRMLERRASSAGVRLRRMRSARSGRPRMNLSACKRCEALG